MPATLLDIAKLNGNDKIVGLIEENRTFAPELSLFPARTIKGTQYKTVVRTGFPSTAFRSANDGFDPGKSTFRNDLVECFIFGGVIQVDKAVALAYEDGPAAWEMIEASGVVRSAMINLGSQIWYGTSKDSKGFPGIKALLPKGGTLTYDATGTAALTASSVYAVKFGIQDTTLVVGQGGSMTLSPFVDQQILGANSKPMPARVADMTAWAGMQVGNANCIGRILNITAAGDTHDLTDKMMAALLAKFPVGYVPDAFFMSRRSRAQLQAQRTVTLFGQGRDRPNQANIAPLPMEYDGIPIYVTDSILNTDVIE